jgi:hypothetical protein
MKLKVKIKKVWLLLVMILIQKQWIYIKV